MKSREIVFYIRKFNPESDEMPYVKEFKVNVTPGMTVLDGLHLIKQTQDPTLSFRFSCRMGVCGSCAMLINGKPTLACNTQILHVTDSALTIAPLPNLSIIRDLVCDLSVLFENHVKIQPFIQRADTEEMTEPTGEFFQSPEELEAFLQFTYCIKCGACMAACPTMATDENYLGPMALAQAYRYSIDSRDDGFANRKDVVAAAHAVYNCHYAGECSQVCPKGVDPGKAIQLMKKQLVLDLLGLKSCKGPARIFELDETAERKEPIKFPPYTAGK